jgi:Winged helix DNA-binding domain
MSPVDLDIAQRRLHAQGLTGQPFDSPASVVEALGAVQAQDYPAALWAIGQRLPTATIQAVEQAIAEKSLLRTLLLRNTVHIVPAPNLPWLLRLAGPRMRMIINNVARANKITLDEQMFATAEEIIAKALQGGNQLTRVELCRILSEGGLPAIDLSGLLLVQRAHADGLVCYAPRDGNRHLLTLVDEWLPDSRDVPYEEALAKLALQYFTGHGPATISDFGWWSGLTLTDCRRGLDAVRSQLAELPSGSDTYWLSPKIATPSRAGTGVWLLPNYDEFTVGYRDRNAIFDPVHAAGVDKPRGNIVFANVIVADGEVVGTWRKSIKNGRVTITASPFAPLPEQRQDQLASAAKRYAEFLGLASQLELQPPRTPAATRPR